MKTILVFAVLFVVIVLGLALAIGKKGRKHVYKIQPILTDNEKEFFGRLTAALGGFHVFPQVSMAAVIAPATRDSKARLAAFRAISQKRIDFVVCRPDFSVVCVVELDDRTHNKSKDNDRDAMLETAGIKTIRYQSKSKPSEQKIADDIRQLGVESSAE